jgi:nuclear pore complex protein Nup205
LANGSSVRITGELANTVNGISTALGISQLLAAVLVVQAESLHSQYPARSTPEICVFIYHQYFTELLDFLHELLRLTISPSSGIADYPFDVLREWVLDLLLTRSSLGQGKGEGMLVDQLLLQLDEHQRKIEELLRTNNPVGVEYEILTYRVGAMREQQNRMAGIIGLVTEGGYLGRGQVIRVLKWLKKSDRVDGLSGVLLA